MNAEEAFAKLDRWLGEYLSRLPPMQRDMEGQWLVRHLLALKPADEPEPKKRGRSG